MADETTETGVIKLTPVEIKKEELQKLAADYKGLVVTRTNLQDADKARKLLKAKRCDIENTVKATKKEVKSHLDKYQSEGDALVAIIEPVEKRLEGEINRINEEVKQEAERKIREEEERKRKIRDRIRVIDEKMGVVRAASVLNILDEIAEALKGERETFFEFNEEGNAAIDSILKAIENRKFLLEEEAKVAALKKQQEEQADDEVISDDDLVFSKEAIDKRMEEITALKPPPFFAKDNVQVEVPYQKDGRTFETTHVYTSYPYGDYSIALSTNIPEPLRIKILSSVKDIFDNESK